jgi:hypothetical protein
MGFLHVWGRNSDSRLLYITNHVREAMEFGVHHNVLGLFSVAEGLIERSGPRLKLFA